MEWQPIETAPRDGTAILAWSKERGQRETQMGRYGEGSPGYAKWKDGDGPLNSGWVWDTHHNWLTTWTPTHWMPLPETPNVEGNRRPATTDFQEGDKA